MLKFVAGGTFAVVLLSVGIGVGYASRNSSGTYTLATSAVTSNQVIGSALWNNTFNDLASEVTNSLSRDGQGGMRAALRGVDGTVAAPALSFTSETGSGLYRIGGSDVGFGISGTKRQEWTSVGSWINGTLGVGGVAADPFDVTISGSASTTATSVLQASLADGNALTGYFGKATSAGSAGVTTYTKNATAANSTLCLGVFGGSASTLCVDGNDKVLTHSLTIGATGTAISARYRGTTSWTPGSVAASTGTSTTITVTGAAAGADCRVTPPLVVGAFTLSCLVTLNTCTVSIYNTLASGPSTGANGTWSCVVENP